MAGAFALRSDVIVRALSRPSPFPDAVFQWAKRPEPAAVVVPIAFEPEPTVFAVLRSLELRDHAGEVGYPGGKPEPADVDLQATALRELREEVGVEPIAVLGRLSPVPVVTGRFLIHPFVADIGDARPVIPTSGGEPGSPPDTPSSELAEILPIPLVPWLEGRAVIEAVRTAWGGLEFLTPHFHLPSRTRSRVVLYGASAFVLWELLLRIAAELGVELPPPRVVEKRPWGDRYAGSEPD